MDSKNLCQEWLEISEKSLCSAVDTNGVLIKGSESITSLVKIEK